jgi:transposase
MSSINSYPNDWKEGRRKRALELVETGWQQSDIAAALGVSRAAVSQWVSKARTEGSESWRALPHPSGPRKLTPEQFNSLPTLLSVGAAAYGFRGNVWTCGRVATVLRQQFGVAYHKAHVSRLLKHLVWTPQVPRRRATQRDEDEITRWRAEVWPELKKKR